MRVWLKSQAGATKGNGSILIFVFSEDHQYDLVDWGSVYDLFIALFRFKQKNSKRPDLVHTYILEISKFV